MLISTQFTGDKDSLRLLNNGHELLNDGNSAVLGINENWTLCYKTVYSLILRILALILQQCEIQELHYC